MRALPIWALCAALLAPLFGSGCSSSGMLDGDADPGGASIFVFPQGAHTGYDGTNTFRVPMSASVMNPTWTIADPSIASFEATTAPTGLEAFGVSWIMVTAKRPGTTTITATAVSSTGEATITVAPYDAAATAVGKNRYYTPDNATAAQRNPCASCHALANGADHSPLVLAFRGDADIQSVITTGEYASDHRILIGVNHVWNLTADELTGIVPYLRQLPPKGFPNP